LKNDFDDKIGNEFKDENENMKKRVRSEDEMEKKFLEMKIMIISR
jgi:hypothetical protein